MRLHSCGILSLRQDLKQLIIRQEVKAREVVTLRLQVFAEAFLHLFQQLVTLSQVVKETVVRAQ